MGSGGSKDVESENNYRRLAAIYDQEIADEIARRNEEFEKKQAVELASRQRSFLYEGVAGAVLTGSVVVASAVYKRPWYAVPVLVPIVMSVGYRYDAAYGEQLGSVKARAQKLLEEDRKRFEIVGGSVTLPEVDRRVALIQRLQKEDSS